MTRGDKKSGDYNFHFYISYNILYFLHYTNVLADSLNPDLSRLKESRLEAGDESLTKTIYKNMQ